LSVGGVSRSIYGKLFRRAKKEFGGRGILLPDMIEILKKVIPALPLLFI